MVEDIIGLHLQHIEAIPAHVTHVQLISGVVIRSRSDGNIRCLLFTLIAQKDVCTIEGCGINGLVECHGEFVKYINSDVVTLWNGLDTLHLETVHR